MNNKRINIIPNPFYIGRYPIFNNIFKRSKLIYFQNTISPKAFLIYKRTHILHYKAIQNLHSHFSYLIAKKISFKNYPFIFFIYKNIFINFQKLFLFSLLFISPILIYKIYEKEINTDLDLRIKNLLINKVCRNEFIINKISWEILLLCKKESINRLLCNLIINDVLPNEGIRNDLYRIIKREVLSYLRSEDCRKELRNLIIKEVMRNEEICNDLYSLIKQFITLKEINFLEDKLEKILVDILAIEAVHTHVSKKVQEEIHKALRDENLIRLTVNMLSEKFK